MFQTPLDHPLDDSAAFFSSHYQTEFYYYPITYFAENPYLGDAK